MKQTALRMKQVGVWTTLVAFLLFIGLLQTFAHAQASGGVLGPPTTYPERHGGEKPGREASADADAINRLSTINVVQIKMSQDVSQRSQDPSVQQLAQRMVRGHIGVGQRLVEMARRVRLEDAATVSLDGDSGALLSSVQKLSGPDLDARYLALMTVNQREMLSALRETESRAENARLRDFARQEIPGAEADLQAIQQVSTTARSASPNLSPVTTP